MKIGRALSTSQYKLAAAESKIQKLEEKIQHLKPSKQRKAIEDPNDRFVRIEDIKKLRVEGLAAPQRPWVPPNVQTPVPRPHLFSSIPKIPK
jgi:hypothetical protein